LPTRIPFTRKPREEAKGSHAPKEAADAPMAHDAGRAGTNGSRGPKEAAERDLELGDLRDALRALKAGDFSVRILPGVRRVTKEVATAFNDVAAMLDGTSVEFVRVSKVVGRDGEMMERAQLKGAAGGWSSQVESFNALIGDLVRPSTEVARVIIAVAAGDLSQKMALEIEGKPVRGSSSASAPRSTRWSISCARSRATSRASPRRSAARGSSAARPRSR
jgi:hypothetical protein